MNAAALAPYDEALRTGAPLRACTSDGRVLALDVPRWLRAADAADTTVLDRCRGPVLDIGCGPGRLVAALTARGVPALGIDISAAGIALLHRLGQPALHRDVFGPIPGEGRWPTVLLLDGNIGIGGDPAALLARTADLLAQAGRAIVEVQDGPPDDAQDGAADGVQDGAADGVHDARRLTMRFLTRAGEPVGPPFPWAEVGLRPLIRCAHRAGYRLHDTWQMDGRTFVELTLG